MKTVMEPYRSVFLGSSDNKLSKDDLSRALFCSMAVYMSNAGAEVLFRRAQTAYPNATFEKVHMSMDLRKAQKFLVGYTEDCTFVAFRGTKNLKDVASDMRTDRQATKFGGFFHKGFYDRADSFAGLHQSPLPGLLATEKRIIFCGHSLGGAVAHMVLFRYLLEPRLENDQLVTNDTYPDSMVSIAFGAPHICDEVAARRINLNKNYKWRFINFVNQNDPVPHMLHNLRCTVEGVWKSALAEADSALQSLGGFAGRCIEGFEDGGPVGAMKVAGRETAHLAARGVVSGARKITSKLQDMSMKEYDSSDALLKPDFHPIGQYISLCSDVPGGNWSSSQCYGGDLGIQDLFQRDVQFTKANLEHHTLNNYRSALISVCFIDIPTGPGDCVSDPQSPQSLGQSLVTSPPPMVTIASWKVLDPNANQQFIVVKGENLLFLREPVSVTGSKGQEPWTIANQSDSFLVIHDPRDPMDSGQEAKDSENAISMIFIKTAFGEINQPILRAEEYPNEEKRLNGASRKLLKIAQSLMVKAIPPLSIRPDSNRDIMTGLDNIMHCVPSLKGERVSTKLTQITTFTNINGGDLENHIKEINFMFKSVVKCLTSRLKVDYRAPTRNLQKCFKSFLRGRPELTIPAVIAGILVLPITLGAALGVLIFAKKWTIIDGYDLVLISAILESSEWSEASTERLNYDDGANGCSVDHLEMVLYKIVEGSSPTFRDMVNRAHSMKAKDVPDFKSENFQKATAESRLKLLKRIKVVYDTISLYNKVVTGVHYIGVFGAEDAGKSTFIKRVLKKIGPSGTRLPETGICTHTKVAAPYMLNNSLWLVDFPGGDGLEHYADMWKQFTALSTSAVMFLDFECDIKKPQVKMYKELKENLGAQTEVIIVFNKVDLMIKRDNIDEFTSDYFKGQRENNHTKLGCKKDAIHFSCVNPKSPDTLKELKKVGVLGFEELMEVVHPLGPPAISSIGPKNG